MALSSDSFIEEKSNVEDGKKRKKKKASDTKAVDTGSAVAAGAATGAAFGPIGALVGAGLGAAGSLADANAREKDTGPRPENRRLSSALSKREEIKRKRELALASLSQAATGIASRIR